MQSASSISRKKIAFIKRGSFSHINANVGKILAENFPEHEVETLDLIDDILRPEKQIVARNTLLTLVRHAAGIAARRRKLSDYFYRTPYLFWAIKKLLEKKLAPRAAELAFTFQTQSLYDASLPGVPHFVYTDHTHLANLFYPNFDPRRLARRDWIDLEKTIYANAAKIFTMSRQVARSVAEHYDIAPEKVACIFGGYNFEMRPLPLQNNNYANKRILFVGVDWERKGGPELVAAFQQVRKKIPEARLAIVGCAPRVDVPNCEIFGRIPLEKVQEQFAASSVFAMPSRVEPFGIACIEAFANAIPVVATRINALADMVEDGASGKLVEVGDVPALGGALIELLDDPKKCRRFGEHGRAAIRERYTWQAVGARLREQINATLALQPPLGRPLSVS